MFKGAITALVTPFTQDNKLDENGLCELIEWQISQGIHGLVPCGTTGESPTLSYDEHKRVIEICVNQVNKRVPVIAGAGSNSTAEAVELATYALKVGADAVLVVTPYYNKPNQKGLLKHYLTVAQSVNLPIIIYNIPSRSVVDILPETMAQLHRSAPNIIGVKDATCSMLRVVQQRRLCGEDFIQLSGDDSTALGFCSHGGVGCISVTANVAPALCVQLQEACAVGDYKTALKINDRLSLLNEALFCEPSPAGSKYALSRMGLIKPFLRSPMFEISSGTAHLIDQALEHAELVTG